MCLSGFLTNNKYGLIDKEFKFNDKKSMDSNGYYDKKKITIIGILDRDDNTCQPAPFTFGSLLTSIKLGWVRRGKPT